MCFGCFKRTVQLDLSVTYETIGPSETDAVVTVIFVHGGGACRSSFVTHAKRLATERNIRSVLLDLPGHGGRVREALSMASAKAAVRNVTTATCRESIAMGKKPIIVGANIGGYVAMELAGEEPELFRAAVVVVACQNVGNGATWKAIFPLLFFDFVIRFFSSERILKLLLKDITYSVALNRASVDFEMARECSLACSVYFQRASEQVLCLRATDSIAAMSRFHGDVWYATAGDDKFPQDMATSLLTISQQSSRGKIVQLTSYEGANRFFTHDMKYYDRFMTDMIAFFDSVIASS